jgi:hypothetical protein
VCVCICKGPSSVFVFAVPVDHCGVLPLNEKPLRTGADL